MDRGHNSPYDRGESDSYYGRPCIPHKKVSGVGRVTDLTLEEKIEYSKGYHDNEERGDKKEYR